jgi:hypothetical protein
MPRTRANAYAMIGRRASAGGVGAKLGNHRFRATGIAGYLKNGGMLQKAAQMANYASTSARGASTVSDRLCTL